MAHQITIAQGPRLFAAGQGVNDNYDLLVEFSLCLAEVFGSFVRVLFVLWQVFAVDLGRNKFYVSFFIVFEWSVFDRSQSIRMLEARYVVGEVTRA